MMMPGPFVGRLNNRQDCFRQTSFANDLWDTKADAKGYSASSDAVVVVNRGECNMVSHTKFCLLRVMLFPPSILWL